MTRAVRIRFCLLTIFWLGASLSGCGGDSASRVQIEDAWARPARAGDIGAVYLAIRNDRRESDGLLEVKSEIAPSVELHETTTSLSNVSQMHSLHRLEIPAGGTVLFKPGGLHIMLVGLKRNLQAGDHFSLSLRFEKSGTLVVEVQVRPE